MVHSASSCDAGLDTVITQVADASQVLWLVRHGESTWNTLRVLNAYLRRIPVERMTWPPLANGCVLRSSAWRLDHGTNPSERRNR